MTSIHRNVGLRSVWVVLVLFGTIALPALSQPLHAQTWGKLYHGPWTEWYTGTTFYGALRTSDGGYLLTGTSTERGVILKVSNDGTLQWSKLVKGNGYQRDTSMNGAVEAPNGDFIVVGQAYTDTTMYPEAGAGSWDNYIIRLTSTGSKVWEKFYARKNVGEVPDTNEYARSIYVDCPEGGAPCRYVVTGHVVYHCVPGCPYYGYRASQTMVIDEDGEVQDDFLMGGPSSTGDGAVQTVYTGDGNYLVLTRLWHSYGGYTIGLQKYGPTGSLIWSRAYYEAYRQEDGEHLLTITPGAVVETENGYVLAGFSYDNVTQDPPLGTYYHFQVDKTTGSTVAWNKKYRVWENWWSYNAGSLVTTPDGGLLAKVEDIITTENDRIFKTSQNDGTKLWVNEYGANLGTITPGAADLAITRSAFDGLLASLSINGLMDESCKALPISDKTDEAVLYPILRTDVFDSFGPSDCNSGIGKVAVYEADRIEPGEYQQVNACTPHGEVTADSNGLFGKVNVGSPGTDRKVYLSNSNGLSNLYVNKVLLSNTRDFSIVAGSDTCTGKTLYPVNAGTPTGCEVTVRFAPVTYGAKQGLVKFDSNDETLLQQVLKGTGVGGAVKVIISPKAARNTGARWRVDGGLWKKNGDLVQLSTGSHEISFRKVKGWRKPDNKIVKIVNGETLQIRAEYRKVAR